MHKNQWLQWHFFHQLSVRDSKFWPGRTHSTCQGLGCGPDFPPARIFNLGWDSRITEPFMAGTTWLLILWRVPRYSNTRMENPPFIYYILVIFPFFPLPRLITKGYNTQFQMVNPHKQLLGPWLWLHFGTSWDIPGIHGLHIPLVLWNFGGKPAKSINIPIKSYKIPCFMAIWWGQSSAETDTSKYPTSIAGVYPH